MLGSCTRKRLGELHRFGKHIRSYQRFARITGRSRDSDRVNIEVLLRRIVNHGVDERDEVLVALAAAIHWLGSNQSSLMYSPIPCNAGFGESDAARHVAGCLASEYAHRSHEEYANIALGYLQQWVDEDWWRRDEYRERTATN